MNGEIPQIPITTLSGLASLSELLPHLPLPAPLDDADASISGVGGPPPTSLLFSQKFQDEASRLLSRSDPALVSQLAQMLSSTSTASLKLLDAVPGLEVMDNSPDNIPRAAPPLLKHVMQTSPVAFKGRSTPNRKGNMKNDDDVVVDDEIGASPNWSKTNGKDGYRRDEVILLNGGTSPDYLSNSLQSRLQPGRPYNAQAKGSPLQAASAPSALDKGRSSYPEPANQGGWSGRCNAHPQRQPPVPPSPSFSDTSTAYHHKASALSAIPTEYLTNQRASHSLKERNLGKRHPWDTWARAISGAFRVPPTLAHGGSLEYPKVALHEMSPEDFGSFDYGSRKARQATTYKWIRHADRIKRRHEFFVDEYGNRKRRRLGSEETGETQEEREKRRRHKERARQRMEAEEDLMQSPMYQRFMTIINGIMEAFEEAALTVNLEEEEDDHDECPTELLISHEKLSDLCAEVAKLKASKALHLVSIERIVRVLSVLERNVRDAARLTPYLEEDAETVIGDGEEDRMWRNVVMDRVLRSADAALAALNIMCAPEMPKQVFVEDAIERCVKFAKFQLQNTIYPDYDPVYRTNSKGTSSMKQKRAKAAVVKNKHSINLYNKITQTVKLLAELSDRSELTDTIVLEISSLGVSAFFVENIPDLQLNAIQLATSIFSRYPKHRQLILDDILSSLARLPSSKKSLRNYKINGEESIQMMSGLVLQLMQSVVTLPEVDEEEDQTVEDEEEIRRRRRRKVDNDVFIEQSYTQALQVAHNFLARFLHKCGMKGEEDFRPLFENFVQDLLTAVNKPEWPSAEVMLRLLGNLLIAQFGNKSIDMSLRISSIDYLGIIASRLRKDAIHSNINNRAIRALMEVLSATDDPDFDEDVQAEEAGRSDAEDEADAENDDHEKTRRRKKTRIDDDDENSDSSYSEDDNSDDPGAKSKKSKSKRKNGKKEGISSENNFHKEARDIRSENRTSVMQQGLLSYLRSQGNSGDPTFSFAQRFYIAQWFKDAQDETKLAMTNKNRAAKKVRDEITVNSDDDDEVVAAEKENHQSEIDELERNTQLLRQAEERKGRMLQLAVDFTTGRPSLERSKMSNDDASLATRYLSAQLPFGQSFDLYLKKILRVLGEPAIAVRTKAMKCLAAVVEVDPSLLERDDMQKGVQARLLDHANSVREAAVDLIGRFVMIRPSLTEKYYPMIVERILDTGVSVRKRVIKILRDICIEQPEFSKNTEICVRIIRRVHDEEGIKKLVSEVFENMWFSPARPKQRGFGTRDADLKAQVDAMIAIKIGQLTDVVHACTAEAGGSAGLEWLEALVASLLKREEDANDEALAAALLAAPGSAKKQARDSTAGNLAREELIQSYQSNVGPVLQACKQLVDALVEKVIDLDLEISKGSTVREKEIDRNLEEEKEDGDLDAMNNQENEEERTEPPVKEEENVTNSKTARLVSCFSALHLFTRVKSSLLATHAITLAQYLESFDSDTSADNAVIVDVNSILENVIPLMDHPSENFLSDVEERLMKNVFSRPQSVIPSSVSCLASLVNQVTHNFKFIKDSLMSIYNNLKNGAKHLKNKDRAMESHLPSLRRDLFTLGLFCKHFSFSDLGFPEHTEERILNTFLYYIHQRDVKDEELKARALDGVGFFCSTHYNLMLGKQIRDLYIALLTKPGKDLVKCKLQVLRNMQTYLMEEENRQTREERAYKAKLKEELLAKEAGIRSKTDGTDSLKEMNDIQSGMASTIIQVYIKAINGCFHSFYKPIRLCALEVLCLVLNQGLIHPVQSVPYLISAATDHDHTIAVKAEKQLAEIDHKYPGFIQMKALQGVRLSYDLQVMHKTIQQITKEDQSHNIILRGLRVDGTSGNTTACLAPVYNHIRGNKGHRRAFLTSLLNLFEDSSTAILQEKIYICDNLAYFPYQQQYEPLFIIHQIDLIVSVSGANLLQAFKENLMPKPGDENSAPAIVNGEAAPTNGNSSPHRTREEIEVEERVWQERERELEARGEFDRLEEEREARERRKRQQEEEMRKRESRLAYDEEDEDLDALVARISDFPSQLMSIYHAWQGCVLLLILKQFLKEYYGITEARIQNYSPQDAGKLNDKPLNRRAGVDRFNPGPALAILQKGDPQYPFDEDAKEDLANEYVRFKNLMLQLDPTDESGFDPEAPEDPGRQQKTSANAFKEYMARGGETVDPNTGIVPVFARPPQVDGETPTPNAFASGAGDLPQHHHSGSVMGRHMGFSHHSDRPVTPSGSSRGSTPARSRLCGGSERKRKRLQPTPVRKQKKKKKRKRVTSDSEDDASDDSDDPSWE